MKLYGSYTSPFVRHCRVALAQEGFAFDFIEADYAQSAQESPTGKVPYFADGNQRLTDSSSIVKYIREKSGNSFLADLQDYERFAMTNTVLDSAINIFLLENDGFDEQQIPYIARQKNRVKNGLDALNTHFQSNRDITQDGALRCACFIDWALFRKRVDINAHDHLQSLLKVAHQEAAFAATAPPR